MIKAGAAKIEITPPAGIPLAGYGCREKKSEKIDDPLYTKSLILSSSKTKIIIITNDLIGIPRDLSKKVRDILNKKIKIPQDNILICASHTHYGPVLKPFYNRKVKAYVENLIKKMVECALSSYENLKEAKIKFGKKKIYKKISYNRDTKRHDGKVEMSFYYPEGRKDLIFGPVDKDLMVIDVEDKNGRPIATLVNFACHPVCHCSSLYSISSNYPGYMMEYVENFKKNICLFTLGAAGNIVPFRREIPEREKMGEYLGKKVIEISSSAEEIEDEEFKILKSFILLPLKQIPPAEKIKKEIEEREKIIEKMENSDFPSFCAEKGKISSLKILLKKAKRKYNPKFVKTEIQIFKIGNGIVVGLPGEIFTEIGMEIKKYSPFKFTMVISLSNDSLDYIPTSEAYECGGYEAENTKIAPGADKIILERVYRLIDRLNSA